MILEGDIYSWGGTSGIGFAILQELVTAGACITVFGRNEEKISHLIDIAPDRIFAKKFDVLQASSDDWSSLLREGTNRFGKLDGGVYTAGITGVTPLKHYDAGQASLILRTSFEGSVSFMRYATKKKYSNAGASFVLFSSVAAHEGPKGLLFYAGAKAAVEIGVRTMAKEIAGRKQRVNSVAPAWVDTPMTRNYLMAVGETEENVHTGELGIGSTEDISGIVMFLLSSRARWITGQNFIVDGGYLRGAWN